MPQARRLPPLYDICIDSAESRRYCFPRFWMIPLLRHGISGARSLSMDWTGLGWIALAFGRSGGMNPFAAGLPAVGV